MHSNQVHHSKSSIGELTTSVVRVNFVAEIRQRDTKFYPFLQIHADMFRESDIKYSHIVRAHPPTNVKI